MSKKERVIAAIERKNPDRIPISDSYWDDTLTRWRSEGMPAAIEPQEYFDLDVYQLSIDSSPRVTPREISRDDENFTFRDRMGYVATKSIGKSRTLHFSEYPAPNRDAWNELKNGFILKSDEPARISTKGFPFRLDMGDSWNQVKEDYARIRDRGYYILGNNYGPHEATWRFRGFTETLMDLAMDPEFIVDIASTFMAFQRQVIDQCLDNGIYIDGFMCTDDVASTNGMLFSPDTWRQVYKPLIKELGDFLKERNTHFWMHCCGNAEAVFEDLIECGLQVINPLEAKSGLDVRKLKDVYGDRLTFNGNIDATAMPDPATMEDEIPAKLEPFRTGAWITTVEFSNWFAGRRFASPQI
jgi:hypothetical protein